MGNIRLSALVLSDGTLPGLGLAGGMILCELRGNLPKQRGVESFNFGKGGLYEQRSALRMQGDMS